MGKYKWDLEELRMYKEAALEACSKIDDEDSINSLENISALYDTMLSFFYKNNGFNDLSDNLSEFSFKDILKDSSSFFNKENYPVIEPIIGGFSVIVDNYKDRKISNNRIVCNNDSIIEITEDFFKKMTPTWMNEEFNKIININPSVINILYNKENIDFGGVTFVDNVMNKRYIHVSRTNHLSDLCILPHEVFHYIFINNEFNIKYKTRFLNEVEGCLANILFAHYYKKNAAINKKYFVDYFKNAIQSNIEDLGIRVFVLKNMIEDNYIDIEGLNNSLEDFGYMFNSQVQLLPYLIKPSERATKFSLSYLVAFDLYYIYKKDPEKCFELLKSIKSVVKTDDILQLLRNNEITFMDDGYKNLINYMKK